MGSWPGPVASAGHGSDAGRLPWSGMTEQRADLPGRWLNRPASSRRVAVMIGVVQPAVPATQSLAATVDSAEVRQVKAVAAELKKRIAEQRRVSEAKGLKEAQELFEKMERQLDKITGSQSLNRKDALIELNEIKDQIQERKDRIGTPEQLRKTLSQMKGLEGGPAEKIADQIQQGDFGKAAEEIRKLAEQIKDGKLSEEQRADVDEKKALALMAEYPSLIKRPVLDTGNTLLVGFDEVKIPHLRIEHRAIPAGPTIADMMANAAVYFGAVHFLARLREPPEADLPFPKARDNFYRAARDGLDAKLIWLDGREADVKTLLADEILHMAREGLVLLGIDKEDIDRHIGIARARTESGQNGAAWQRAHAETCGRDFNRLTADYLALQRSGVPVHEWPL